MPDVWLPPGAKQFDAEIEKAIEESDDPARMRAAAEFLAEGGFSFPTENFGASVAPDSAVLLVADKWSRIETPKGNKPLTAFVKSDELKRMILDGTLNYENGYVVETAENAVMNELCPALLVRLREFQLFTPLEHAQIPAKAPGGWSEIVQAEGFALAVDQGDGTYVYFATGPLRPAGGLVLPARSREKVGRNEPCPCGSGIKHKKCCGS